jgi:hypothetical protein
MCCVHSFLKGRVAQCYIQHSCFLLLVTNISKKNVKFHSQYKTAILLLYRRLPVRVKADALCELILAYATDVNSTGK